MCGRYDNLIAHDAYVVLFRADRIPRSNFPPRYNITPTDQIPIVRIDPRDGERELVMARWGLISAGSVPGTGKPRDKNLLSHTRCGGIDPSGHLDTATVLTQIGSSPDLARAENTPRRSAEWFMTG
jgi:putative SOS response-associated peptidase YedK